MQTNRRGNRGDRAQGISDTRGFGGRCGRQAYAYGRCLSKSGVDITPARRLPLRMDTQIALGNLKQQPKYDTFIVHSYIQPALAAK